MSPLESVAFANNLSRQRSSLDDELALVIGVDKRKPSTVAPLLVDIRDAAQMLAVSERTVWRLVQVGQLPAPIHLGRCARWRTVDLEAFVDAPAEPQLSLVKTIDEGTLATMTQRVKADGSDIGSENKSRGTVTEAGVARHGC